MQIIVMETKIAAPIERCFLLSTSIDLHTHSTAHTAEQAIAGVTHGLIRAGESVTWRGRHFGFMLQHTSQITVYDPPRYFQDTMQHGIFRSFIHDHFFHAADSGTLMRDELHFAAPLGILGRAAEKLVLRRHLTQFLRQRNAVLRAVAEGHSWQQYLPQ